MRTLLHLPDGLSAEAPEGVGRNPLDVAVLLEVPEQQAEEQPSQADFRDTAANDRWGVSAVFKAVSLALIVERSYQAKPSGGCVKRGGVGWCRAACKLRELFQA